MTKKIKVFITAILALGILGFCVMGCQSEKASRYLPVDKVRYRLEKDNESTYKIPVPKFSSIR